MEDKLKKIAKNENRFLLVIFTIFFIALVAFIILILALDKVEYRRDIGQEFEDRNTIVVSAQGQVFAEPDLAIVNFSVISEKETIVDAMQENREKMNAIIAFMKENEIEDRDLRTIAFRVNPRYEWHDENDFRRGRRVLVGYEVRQSLEVRIRDMEKIGAIIQGGTDLGADQVKSLRFTIDDKEELKNQARKQAIKEARERARVLADQLDVRLIRIVNFREGRQIPIFPRFGLDMPIPVPTAPGRDVVPEIKIGEDKIQITVHITYEIK